MKWYGLALLFVQNVFGIFLVTDANRARRRRQTVLNAGQRPAVNPQTDARQQQLPSNLQGQMSYQQQPQQQQQQQLQLQQSQQQQYGQAGLGAARDTNLGQGQGQAGRQYYSGYSNQYGSQGGSYYPYGGSQYGSGQCKRGALFLWSESPFWHLSRSTIWSRNGILW